MSSPILAASGIAVALGGFLLAALRSVGLPSRLMCRRVLVPVALLLLLAAGAGLPLVARYRESYRSIVYRALYGEPTDGWAWIDEHVTGARIAYTGAPLPLPLYGRALQNEVRYVNVAGDLDDRHHNFSHRGTSYREAPDYETWARNLREWGADFLVVYDHSSIPIERSWAEAHPAEFVSVFSNGGIQIFRIQQR